MAHINHRRLCGYCALATLVIQLLQKAGVAPDESFVPFAWSAIGRNSALSCPVALSAVAPVGSSIRCRGYASRVSMLATDGCEPLRMSCPFSQTEAIANLPFRLDNSVYLEVQSDDRIFGCVQSFVSKAIKGARSIHADFTKSPYDDDDDEGDHVPVPFRLRKHASRRELETTVQIPDALIGLGWHSFNFSYGEQSLKIIALLQHIGQRPFQGDLLSSLVLFVEGFDQTPLLKLCQEAVQAARQLKKNRVTMWGYDVQFSQWKPINNRPARSLDSIVLEEGAKKLLLGDVEWFIKDETQNFYFQHGIPYHRCYLFFGEPGTGKTSFAYSLAGHLKRHLCFLQMDRGMTDGSFRMAMASLPAMSMLVLEDVDALFTLDRGTDQQKSSLSFSGFLNCLDGNGAPDDVVICMTTNYPDRLDPAVLRPGRIDVKVEFKKPGEDVAMKYFLTFYPDAVDDAAAFGRAVGSRLAEHKVSMAQLQHFFLACNRQKLLPAEAALRIVDFDFAESQFSSQETIGFSV